LQWTDKKSVLWRNHRRDHDACARTETKSGDPKLKESMQTVIEFVEVEIALILEVAVSEVDRDRQLVSYGLDSLGAAELIESVSRRFGVEIEMEQLANTNLVQVARIINSKE